MSAPGIPHIPVLLEEVVAALNPRGGDLIVDATLGAGGYTRRLLDEGATVHAFDRDPDAIAAVQNNPGKWPELASNPPRLVLHARRFSEMVEGLGDVGVDKVDGVVMDIGVSSMQLDQAGRGFAFGSDGPLDMRMSQDGMSAADFVNEADEAQIADVLYLYGEERQSRRLARAIVAARPLETTGDLARVVRKALGYNPAYKGSNAPKDPAIRTFQAIRIHVNGELDELDAALEASETLLQGGGRLAVVTFHSLEDRKVKRFLRDASSAGQSTSRHLPQTATAPAPFEKVSKGVRPGEAELEVNPRSRSATLRSAVRTSTPPRNPSSPEPYGTPGRRKVA
ncbi:MULTISPECIES: 16S rRNA (cytosine(1402)-N(4))-methyltransferase RsmH [Sphingomonadaceae]|uniref:16S rRNA (cytosine(1402)-N(4))-methyltransferase RsmH n=1 Tax=Sphingomonadaceae TaxID=41297 RepID=UPI00055B0E1E|nr:MULTISPECIES: 16S rRNA (cytosine(1402)-N(4))-methyltransferase RsmH [Sphingomonadaceae]MBF7012390.1 16S rRNA (cytosine(1402)-N(4))-methyltransferase RsmH [Novosphingobium sp. HR1a]WJM27131.1 16S rRNA (cytosine(1402)-N(4))-methyltransferase RsmH [Novosphingobium resinovorum]GLK46664.1 ribosomal RNA small subunit methyltransferase H [Novosphingobium resinovorum]